MVPSFFALKGREVQLLLWLWSWTWRERKRCAKTDAQARAAAFVLHSTEMNALEEGDLSISQFSLRSTPN